MSSDPAAATGPTAPVTIKKYANRRLYNTGTSAYVTLEDLATMVKKGQDFAVFDAKSGDDITRSVLTQIIFEQEGKGGQSLLPISFLRQLIRFYGDSMQMLVPSYLEFTLDKLAKDDGGMRDQFAAAFKTGPLANGPLATVTRPMFAQIEEQTKQNMALFRQALSMFGPFGALGGKAPAATANAPPPTGAGPEAANDATPPRPQGVSPPDDLDVMRRQIDEMQRRIENLASQR